MAAAGIGGGALVAPSVSTKLEHRRELLGEEEEEEDKRPDRPDLAELQEVALTRDPATGTVPRERLVTAQAEIQQLLLARAGQRSLAGSLSAAIWVEKGPSNIGGRVRALMPDPSDATGNKVWAGSVGGGLWKSNNAASATPTWSKVDDTFANLAISTLAYDPSNPDIMYFGTGEGFFNGDAIRGLGIWKSTNHGATWTQLASTNNNSVFYYTYKIVVDANGWIYAATGLGLRRSKDGGATWAAVAFAGNRVGDVDVNPVSGAVYLTCSPATTGGGIYRSPSGDAGTFTDLKAPVGSGLPNVNTTTRAEVALAPSNPSQMYALFCSSGGGTPALPGNTLYGVYRSLDGGTTWQELPKPNDADTGIPDADFTRGQAWYDLAIAVSPTDPNTVFVGGIDIFKTSNGTTATASEVAWQQVTHWYGGFGFQNVHADQHAIAFVAGSGTHAYFGHDGGVSRTTTAAAAIPTLTTINTNFNVTQFYSVAAHPTNTNYFLAGAQDNGTQQFGTLSGTSTQDVIGGDGAFCFIDEDEPQYQFGTYVYSNIYRSSNGGASFPALVTNNNGSFINPMEYDSKANVLYYGYTANNLRRTLQATGTPVSSTISLVTTAVPTPGTITHVAVSPNVDNRVYVGTNTGKIFRIDNATATVPVITPIYISGPTDVSISCITVEKSTATPDPDQHLLATVANYGATSVLQTTNAGTTWTSAEGNIPDMPVRWVLFDPTDGKRAMVATELGVWTTDDLAATPVAWQPSNTNLANVRVDMLRLRKADKTVVAATHGRGLFTSNIFNLAPVPVELVSFTGTATDQGVVLRWQTASEQQASSFEVERSTDGKQFKRLVSVPAAGTSTSLRTYKYLDGTAGPGQHFYRLHQLDFDGTAAYSPVVPVRVQPLIAPLFTSAYPMPFGTQLTLQLPQPLAAGSTATFTDAQGRTAYTAALHGEGRQVPLPVPASLASGTYVLTVRSAGKQTSQRVVRR